MKFRGCGLWRGVTVAKQVVYENDIICDRFHVCFHFGGAKMPRDLEVII